MKKNFITKEYSIEPVSGTFNMKEGRNFMVSKMLELEDIMRIDENDIIWSENESGIQGVGIDNQNLKLDVFDLKKNNHNIRITPLQSEQEKKEFTRWEFNFNIKAMIREYLFAQLKRNRTFSGVENSKTRDNSVNNAIYNYIDSNVLPRINFFTVELYIRYYKISEKQDNGVIALQYDSTFRKNLTNLTPNANETNIQYQNRIIQFKKNIKVKNFQLTTDANEDIATLVYKQTESSLNYKFDYYFDIVYEKS